MDFIIWLVIFGAVVSAIGGIIWWVIVFFIIKSGVRLAQQNLDQLLPDIERMLRQTTNSLTGQLDSQQQALVVNMMMRAQNNMHQLDDLHRQRYEIRVGKIRGKASEIGIDLSPHVEPDEPWPKK
jgi:hypothetical protein